MMTKNANPFDIFNQWFQEAKNTGTNNFEAVCLATASQSGRPSARMVLFKGIIDDGFSFFTNYESRKGQELINNPHASIVFYWDVLGKQIRVEGKVKKLSGGQSDQYWYSRPFDSQVSGAVSSQSRPISSHDELVRRAEALRAKYKNQGKVPRPAHWGGFTIIPEKIEFWINQAHRLHIRHVFELTNGHWVLKELAP